AVAVALDVRTDPEQVLGVGRHDNRARFAFRQLKQRLTEREARLFGGARAPVGGASHGAPSSASARARISSLTLLLCQREVFSAKLTPLPLTVCAMSAEGRS